MPRSSWDPFALLLIDVQRDFWTDAVARAFPDFESNVARLLSLCRDEGIEVVHVHARFKPDQSDWMIRYRLSGRIPCIEGTPGAELLPCAMPADGEKVITKQVFDAFQNPETDRYLRGRNKRFLLVAGLVTGVCDLLTAASAAQRGYLVAMVEDCCADQPTAHGVILDRYPFMFERVTVNSLMQQRSQWQDQLAQIADGS